MTVDETSYEKLLQATSECLYLRAADGRMLVITPACEQLTGYAAAEFVSRPALLDDLVVESDRPRWKAQIAAASETTTDTPIEVRIRAKSGQIRWIDHCVRHTGADVDAPGGTIGRFRDITARKAAETRANQLAAIVDSTHDAIISKDLDGRIISWNHGAERLYGYSAQEAIGQPISMLVSERAMDDLPEILHRIKQGDGVENFETVRRRKDGQEIEVALTISPLYDAEGRIIGGATIARDITDRNAAQRNLQQFSAELEKRVMERTHALQTEMAEHKRTGEQLSRRTADLVRSNTELQQFAYVTSHDLQEPLRMMSSFSQLLKNRYADKLDQDANEFLDFIVDGANRLQDMIRGLLACAQVERRGRPFAPTDLNVVLSETIANLTSIIARTSATVTLDELPTVMADKVQMTQLLQNLVGNALKFAGPEPPRIHVSANQKKEEGWTIAVRDHGIGIDPKYAERVFGLFQRLHERGEYSGTGIGLALCRRIVERHGGRIWVESSLANGATFYFTIPTREHATASEAADADDSDGA